MSPPQLSLVALFGSKPSSLARLIAYTRQEALYFSEHFTFYPYPVTQVHATIIGMERLLSDEELINLNLFTQKKTKKIMQFSHLKHILKQYLPLRIRIGGFAENDKKILSNGEKFFDRTLSFNPGTGKLVVIGWPHTDNDFSERRLWKLRSNLEKYCNLGHKYIDDNDFYMVFGSLKNHSENEEGSRRFIKHMQNFLSENPVFLDIDLDSLAIVAYEDPDLTVDHTQVYPLKGLLSSPDEIIRLYH